MKNLFIVALVMVGIMSWWRGQENTNSPMAWLPDILSQDSNKKVASAGPRQVTMYATPTCGYCKKARRFFADNNIPYIEKNVNSSAEAAREMRDLGGSGVPTILIDDVVIRGWNERALRDTLL